jgi:hypothetical protein
MQAFLLAATATSAEQLTIALQVHAYRRPESTVQQALGAMFMSRFQGPFHADPRLAPSKGVAMCQYTQWVSPVNPQVDLYMGAAAPPHTRLCLPFARLRNLAQLRIGCAHLEVEQGRKCRPTAPQQDRVCRLCSVEGTPQERKVAILARTGITGNVEDLKHFLLECPAYDDLRAVCPAFPADVYTRAVGHLVWSWMCGSSYGAF